MKTNDVLAFILIFLLTFFMFQYNVLGLKDVICRLVSENEKLSKLLGCGGGVIPPPPAPPEMPPNRTSEKLPSVVGGQQTNNVLSNGGVTVYTGAPSGRLIGSISGGPGSFSKPAEAEILKILSKTSPTAVKGSTSPQIQGVTVFFYPDMRESGWYKFQLSAFYESCGFSESKTFITPSQNLYITCLGGDCFSYALPAGSRPITKGEAEELVRRYCPNGWNAALSSSSVPPNYAWVCMIWWSMKADPQASKLLEGASKDAYLAPMMKINEPYFRSPIAIIAPVDLINQYIDGPCSSSHVQKVKVYYRVLFCDNAESRTAPPDNTCKPYTDWKEGVSLTVYTTATPSGESALKAYESVKYGGVDFLEVNGRVYSIISLHSLGIPSRVCVGITDILINIGISLMIAGTILLLYRKVRG
ncbi:MAG: hypothetical protein QW721_01960 [Desulfurococcaceae archaeon]